MNNNKQNVIFVPIMSPIAPARPVEKGQPFPMEYVKWHKALVNYFSNREDCNFIWKGFFLPNQGFDLISRIINDKNYSNIKFRTDNFIRYIKMADKIIFDQPSAAFFECIFSGIPILGLYRPEDQRLRGNAYNSFGSSLKPYNNIEEGINLVKKFIDGNSSDYIVNFDPGNDSLNSIFD